MQYIEIHCKSINFGRVFPGEANFGFWFFFLKDQKVIAMSYNQQDPCIQYSKEENSLELTTERITENKKETIKIAIPLTVSNIVVSLG